MTANKDSPRQIQVLVVDDSAFMRTALSRMITSDSGLWVAGTAQNGHEALKKITELQPDVVTLDVEMTGMSGLEILKRIMQDCPRPVIIVSSLTEEGAEITLDCLAKGAFDCLPKKLSYVSLDITKIRDDLIAKIKAAAQSGRKRPMARVTQADIPKPRATPSAPAHGPPANVVAIGISTGGPKALQEVLPLFPADLPVGILIVQHMPVGFTGPFARRLDNLCQISVREAADGDSVEPGVAYIAPAGWHMLVARRGPLKVALQLSHSPEHSLHTPSADVMMLSVAEVYGSRAMGIIMTGMGADGLLGMKAILKAGGMTLGQDETSCAVYGMPRSCAEAGVLQRVVGLFQIPQQVLQATHYRSSVPARSTK